MDSNAHMRYFGGYFRFKSKSHFLNIDFLDAGQHCESSPLDGVHLDAENQQKLALAVADRVRSMQ